MKKTLSLKANAVETTGKTVRWINTNDSRRIEYMYIIAGTTFIKQCDVVYNGHEIENIQCPHGKYTVIYDKTDPGNSIMDFKQPSK